MNDKSYLYSLKREKNCISQYILKIESMCYKSCYPEKIGAAYAEE